MVKIVRNQLYAELARPGTLVVWDYREILYPAYYPCESYWGDRAAPRAYAESVVIALVHA